MVSVLLVDDSFALREALARSLARRGCRVTTAASGLEAYDVLRKTTVDVVVTDLYMPERDGLWLWRQALLEWPELRGHFVLISAVPPQAATLALFNATERFLLKPLAIAELWTAVQDAAYAKPRPRRPSPVPSSLYSISRAAEREQGAGSR
jgi:CheY-like chemotaxis protein